ncbi:2-oxoglutarate ferredoxin oxidoreductase subunit gamma [Sporobacter termitidis DSM 10068]|uniref:2-oxoglutarate ferredoxin oxidoreductase subunit gamma n=1 Tax=Sporobacter termitidis DSM 10068 TaxID=1123282 RepID=A0A1M5Z6H6_9FIRM|nr:2-oxoacid:acceptor oxidoreductase family protein [Sporobacter termitidis]SHI19856.1 2-oxoglutarate ferredoxin oxidoreductase subunit gamma [Sporobacter termitidis DSM 10068]
MSTHKLFFAGSGGQGILLMGQMITYAAMLEDKSATFLPSYGPEMRGGTANCTVVVSDKPVGCPLIYEADAIVVMNLPSLIKFEPMVKPGGALLVNTSIIDQPAKRTDIRVLNVPVNEIAIELGNVKVGNMVMLGALVRATGVVSEESIHQVMHKTFTGAKAKLNDANMKAFAYYK